MWKSSIILLIATVSVVISNNCHHRDYGNGATVCVCSTEYCDDLAPLNRTSKGVATSYVTSKIGDRFAQRKLKFLKNLLIVEPNNSVVTIDRKQKFQKIVGFGGAFTDAAGINIAKLSKPLQDTLISNYFGQNGIGYSIGRIPIGGSDFSTRPYSYDDHPNDFTLDTFALQEEDYKFKIPYLQMAQEISEHKVKYFGSPWSPPAWMKDNGEFNHGGFLKGQPGGKYYKLFAKYFIKFLQAYEKHNLTMWGLTVENEPNAGYVPEYKWNCLGFNASLERDFVKLDLGPMLHDNGYTNDKLKLMIYDDQLPNLVNFNDIVLSDVDAAKYVSGVAFHWYHSDEQNRYNIDKIVKHYPQYFVLSTEACDIWEGEKHVLLGNWDTFDRYANDIIKNLNHHVTGWVDWNIALDLEGGPNWAQNYVDAPIIVNSTGQEYYKQPSFYALGHFSKFLVPGSVRISINSINKDNFDVVAFVRPDQSTVMVLLNRNLNPVDIVILDPQNGYLNIAVKPQSIETLIWY